jgi:hypothetical protein
MMKMRIYMTKKKTRGTLHTLLVMAKEIDKLNLLMVEGIITE